MLFLLLCKIMFPGPVGALTNNFLANNVILNISFDSLITPIYKSPLSKGSITKRLLTKDGERKVVSEFSILAHKWLEIALWN